MKIHFESSLDYQQAAIESVCGLFRGQEICRTEFTVTHNTGGPQMDAFAEGSLGIGNRLSLLDDQILENLQAIQLENGLRPSDTLASGDFTIEMETGTGKTYVYLRTIFELNRRYGFTKFVIVVPSVAIKEGVYKTIDMTNDHLRSLYANVPFEYFVYDSSELGKVRNFATSPNIQIMVVTVGAINKKDVNNLYKDSEKTGGERPIDLIKATRPIVIVDEPQSVDGGLEGQGKKALDEMNPLCTLRYSATHVPNPKHHMVYRLDAVDAYERRLVKQIEVASASIDGNFNKPYVELVSVTNKRGAIRARIIVHRDRGNGPEPVEIEVQSGDLLEQETNRAIYAEYRVGDLRASRAEQLMELRYPGGELMMRPGDVHGGVNPDELDRQMIRRTIKEHLEKEKLRGPQGIKVLSLFFIKSVHDYRQYDDDGNATKGRLARIFEEEYQRAAKLPEYKSLFEEIDLSVEAPAVHEGYFSIDKRGRLTDTDEGNASGRENAERAFNLIMREKEALLSFDTKLKFIFSHSALGEGWDNPNVFQICVLRDMNTERKRRQTIGRGLRLCVNQNGERVRGTDINTLTVIATESYEKFAENLQKEIEADTGIRFGIVEKHLFAAIQTRDAQSTAHALGAQGSEAIWNYLKDQQLVDAAGRVQDSLRAAMKNNTLSLPDQYKDLLPQVRELLRKVAGRLEVRNADERKVVHTREARLQSAEFKALWDRIKHHTTYRVNFDNDKLIRDCIDAIRHSPPINRTRLSWRKADLAIGRGGVEAGTARTDAPVTLNDDAIELPDVLTDLQDKTQLTRRSLVKILLECGRLDDFRRNPQQFIEQAADAINAARRLALVDGIKYQRIGDHAYWAQELFVEKELSGYLSNMLAVEKCVYEHVVYDSGGIERKFAEELEANSAVKVYAKLPDWFKIPTPLGTYNPDWAVLVEKEGEERLYFVVETKGSLLVQDLRTKEAARIACGRAHFEALSIGENPARYVVATDTADLMKHV